MECLHDMEVLYSLSDAHIEHCKRCKKDFVYPLDYQGEFDRTKFLKDHKRDYLQPSDQLFQQEFSKDNYISVND